MNDGPTTAPRRPKSISKRLLTTIDIRLRDNQRVRRTLPVWGRIDRQLPFLCVYRRPVRGSDPGTYRFATSEASYLLCSAQKKLQPEITDLVQSVAGVMIDHFGAFLILELWAGPANHKKEGPVSTAEMIPEFEVLAQRPDRVVATAGVALGVAPLGWDDDAAGGFLGGKHWKIRRWGS